MVFVFHAKKDSGQSIRLYHYTMGFMSVKLNIVHFMTSRR